MALPEPETCPSTRDIRDLLALARALRERGTELLARPDRLQKRAEAQLTDLLDHQIRLRLAATPLTQIGAAVHGGLQGPLEQARLSTVAEVLGTSHADLTRVTGLGTQHTARLIAAAGRLAITISREVTVRLDPAHRDPMQTALLASLVALRRALDATLDLRPKIEALNAEIDDLLIAAGPAESGLRMWLSARHRRDAAQVAALHLRRFMFSRSTVSLAVELRQRCAELDGWLPNTDWLWRDYEADSASYQVLLDGLSPRRQDLEGLRVLARLVADHPMRAPRRRIRRSHAAR